MNPVEIDCFTCYNSNQLTFSQFSLIGNLVLLSEHGHSAAKSEVSVRRIDIRVGALEILVTYMMTIPCGQGYGVAGVKNE